MTEETRIPTEGEETPISASAPAPVEEQAADGHPEDNGSATAPEAEQKDYEAMAAADLAEIKRLDPTYAPASHLCELPFARRFAALRDLGLSVTEALAAVTPRFSPHDTRSHLRASAPGGARTPGGLLSHEELKAAKELFSDLSEGELHSLYRRVTAEH